MSVLRIPVDSRALRDNPLGDPSRRDLYVVAPDDASPEERLPLVWYLTGYSGVGRSMLGHDPWQEGLEERLVRLRAEGRIGKMRVALPDAFTRFGGSQYVSSSAHGDYEAYLWEECRAAAELHFGVSGHAVIGKSSGGYGALWSAIRRPGLFRAAVCHSGDMGFRLAYGSSLPGLFEAMYKHGSVERWLSDFERAHHKRSPKWFEAVSALALCAAYSPDPSKPFGIALPFDTTTWRLDEAVLARWDAMDPLNLVDRPEVQASLQKLDLLFIDCGSRDEYHLQWGARAFTRKLTCLGVRHTYEEFDDGHRSTTYRLDVTLPTIFGVMSR